MDWTGLDGLTLHPRWVTEIDERDGYTRVHIIALTRRICWASRAVWTWRFLFLFGRGCEGVTDGSESASTQIKEGGEKCGKAG